MRLPLHDSSSRRAILTALAAALPMPLLPLPSVADGRTVAQSVGIDNKETLSGAVGIIWGGRERCDPTDDTCQAGGTDGAAAEALAVPQPRSAVTDRFALDLVIAGQAAGRITLGVYRDAAPASSDTLLQLVRGELRSDPDDVPATLERSNLVRVLKDREAVQHGLDSSKASHLRLAPSHSGSPGPRAEPGPLGPSSAALEPLRGARPKHQCYLLWPSRWCWAALRFPTASCAS